MQKNGNRKIKIKVKYESYPFQRSDFEIIFWYIFTSFLTSQFVCVHWMSNRNDKSMVNSIFASYTIKRYNTGNTQIMMVILLLKIACWLAIIYKRDSKVHILNMIISFPVTFYIIIIITAAVGIVVGVVWSWISC